MSNPNPSRTSHTHRRNTFPPPHLSKSIDSSSSSSYNPTTHLSKLGISRKTSRARSPPPSLSLPTHPPQHSHSSKTPLSKSALFPKTKPLVSHPDPTTAKRVVSENNPKLVHDVAVKEKEKEKEKGVSNSVVKPMVMMRLGRSRSLCDPKVELSNFFLINGVKLVNADMPPFMQIHAVGCARNTCDSLEKFSSRALALSLKKEFDGEYGPAWHCIVGTSFGSFVTHSVGGFLYFSMDQKLHILLFKTTVERAAPK